MVIVSAPKDEKEKVVPVQPKPATPKKSSKK